MNDMQELVTVEQAVRVIRVAAVGLPLAGLAIGALVGALHRRVARGLGGGLLCGLVGPAVWVLWLAHSVIVSHYGLDSVKGLVVALALFAVVGVVVGVGVGYVTGRLGRGASRQDAPSSDARV